MTDWVTNHRTGGPIYHIAGIAALNDEALFIEGWSAAEPGERWAIGRLSTLRVPAPSTAGNYYLTIYARGPTAGSATTANPIEVRVNNLPIGHFQCVESAAFGFYIPEHAFRTEEFVKIEFHSTATFKPSSATDSGDDRELSFALQSLKLSLDANSASTKADPTAEKTKKTAFDIDTTPLPDLFVDFESLGENCEFGLVQRACGAEPLGLLRFSSAPIAKLTKALESEFRNVGAPGTLEAVIETDASEYMILDRAFGFYYHSFTKIKDITPQSLVAREERRVPLLARKLLEDLSNAEKIFVYKPISYVSMPSVLALFAALRSYARVTLLYVQDTRWADVKAPIKLILPGLVYGTLDKTAPPEAAGEFDLGSWVRLCRRTKRLIQTTGT